MTERVIVAGAGPVGCTAALALVQRGIPVVLVEKEPALAEDLRASTFQPPTLEMLDALGVTQRLLPDGLLAPIYQFRQHDSGDYVDFDLGVLAHDTAYPTRVQVEQFKLTRTIVALLQDDPRAEVRLGTRATGIAQDERGVALSVVGPGGAEERIDGSYLIAADGSTSAIRSWLGVPFEGFTYPEKFLSIGTAVDFPRWLPELANVVYISDPAAWCALIRVPGSWRVFAPTDPERSDEESISAAYCEARVASVAAIGEPIVMHHRSIYRVHQRVAATFDIGRVLLAGDAAHLNIPLGGLGMNSGIHDAINLVEKLDAVLHAGAEPAPLLAQYTRQRRTVAMEFVQEQTIRNKRVLQERDPAVRREHFEQMRRTAAHPAAARAFLRRSAMLDSLERAAAIA